MKATLYTSPLASAAHEEVFLPWLRRAAALAPVSRKAVAVLVPQRSDAYFLKSLALSTGLGLWGVHFLTPGDLRDRLAAHWGSISRVPSREQLRLLLATAAERVAESESGATVSVAAGPDQLLKAIDMIGGAGWNFDEAGPVRLRPVVQEFHGLLRTAGWQMVHDADRAGLQAADPARPCFQDLFVLGFNAVHWPLWPLLETAVRQAENSTICLSEPRTEGEELDAAWIGTWENTFEAAESIASDQTAPFAEFLRLPESAAGRKQRETEPIREIDFLVGLDTAGQARALVARILQYLADPACGRLGVLFPSAGALSRRVAALLAELDVPHQDGLAHHGPGPLEDPAWPAWLALQESPRLPSLLQFLESSPDAPFASLPGDKVTSKLRRVAQELLIDDLDVLAEYLSQDSHEPSKILAEALRALPLLPQTASLGEYFQRSGQIFRSHGWSERAETLDGLAAEWQPNLPLSISRRTWLRWLQETLSSWKPRRSEAGSHPYSRLHLLPYLHAEAQAWTHLIAPGLNEGQWPPIIEESGFLDEEEITALNARVRTLNQRAAVQGRQGEGHLAVLPGKTLCLGPAQRRAMIGRQFFNTLESATVALTASMQLREEAAPERPLNPSEFFTGLHFAARGRAVSQQTLDSLQEETARWLAASGLWKATAPDLATARSTRLAYDVRRDVNSGFGEYEFALRSAPAIPPRLNATAWEKTLGSPAQVFLDVLLGVGPTDGDDETPWALAQGIWVHRWLSTLTQAANPGALAPLLAPAALRERVHGSAETFRGRVAAALATVRRPLPDWWQSTWQEAASATSQLAASVAAVQGRTHAATEWTIDNIALPVEGGSLSVRGRVDLLLGSSEALEDLWLVDYKTGNRKALTKRDLARGQGIQLALYALALRASGARQVAVSLLTPGGKLDQPQIQLADLDDLASLWRVLLRIQETGVFGMLGVLRDEFGYGQDYPLATLAIDEDILMEKWALTHPEFVLEEEEA